VVVMEGAAGRVGRRRSVRVVLWVDILGQGFCESSSGAEKPPSYGTV